MQTKTHYVTAKMVYVTGQNLMVNDEIEFSYDGSMRLGTIEAMKQCGRTGQSAITVRGTGFVKCFNGRKMQNTKILNFVE